MMPPQMLTIAQVQGLLGVSRSKIYDLQRNGLLEMRRLGARTMRITGESVQNLVDHPELVGPVQPMVIRRLSPAEAAQFTGLQVGRLAKLRMTGGGPRYIKIGKRIVYDAADIEAWLEKHKYESTASSKQTAS